MSCVFQQCPDEFRNPVFWDEAMIRLAGGDLIAKPGEPRHFAMKKEIRRARAEPLEKRDGAKFAKEGVASLHWVDRSRSEKRMFLMPSMRNDSYTAPDVVLINAPLDSSRAEETQSYS